MNPSLYFQITTKMSINENLAANIVTCPAEVLLHIFTHLKPKYVMKCREVCWRWKLIVDANCASDAYWKRQCEIDFRDVYKTAYNRREDGSSWYNLYR